MKCRRCKGTGEEPAVNGSTPSFRVPEDVWAALDRAPRLGAVPKLRTPEFWQAEVRANVGVDFAREILKAEAWMVANQPKKKLAAFLHNWLGRADRDDA